MILRTYFESIIDKNEKDKRKKPLSSQVRVNKTRRAHRVPNEKTKWALLSIVKLLDKILDSFGLHRYPYSSNINKKKGFRTVIKLLEKIIKNDLIKMIEPNQNGFKLHEKKTIKTELFFILIIEPKPKKNT